MELLNQHEALEILKVSYKRLRTLEKEGRLRAMRISLGTVRYLKSDVIKLREELSQGGE